MEDLLEAITAEWPEYDEDWDDKTADAKSQFSDDGDLTAGILQDQQAIGGVGMIPSTASFRPLEREKQAPLSNVAGMGVKRLVCSVLLFNESGGGCLVFYIIIY